MGEEEILRRFIDEEIVYDGDEGPTAWDEPLLDGRLDSMAVLQLVVFIEERFHVRIDDDELVPENFCTIERLAALVRHSGTAVTSPTSPVEPTVP